MEEPIPTRYVFVMLLAITDATGHVIGTDVAIARRLNMPLEDFQSCIAKLMEPDPDSNSQEHEGRRVLRSEGERGYMLVNYLTYRAIRDEKSRQEYMKEYMKNYRATRPASRSRSKPLTVRKQRKPLLAKEEGELRVNNESDSAPLEPDDCFGCGHCAECRKRDQE